MSTALSC